MTTTSFQRAYILHRYAYRDTSLLLDVFTEEGSRLGLIAKGGRRPRSPFRGLMEPFQPLSIRFSGRGELVNLVSAEACGAPISLPGKRLIIGFYINELVLRLIQRHDPHPGFYTEYEYALHQLAALQAEDKLGAERLLRLFEKQLLEAMGYALLLDQDAQTSQPIDATKHYCYDIERGPIEQALAQTPGTMVNGANLIALRSNNLHSAETLREVKRLMRALLAVHLNGRPLASRQIMADVEQSLRNAT